MEINIIDGLGTRGIVTNRKPYITKDQNGNVTLNAHTNMYSANLEIILSLEDLADIIALMGQKENK